MTTGSAAPAPNFPRDDSLDQGPVEIDTLLAALRTRPIAHRVRRIQQDPRFHRDDLAEHFLAEAAARILDDPGAAQENTALAIAVAEGLDASAFGPSRLSDLLGRCWARHGNALRVYGDPHGAEKAFGQARSFLRRGTGDRRLAARCAELEASLLKDQQRFEAAHRRLEDAITIYRRGRIQPALGRALVVKGSFLLFENRPESALRVLREAVPLLRPEDDPRTFVLCAHNLINALNGTGYSIAAHALVADIRRLYERLGDHINLLRLDWMVAEINLELGRETQAEQGLRAVRQGFLDRGMAYDAALVSLDLAVIYLEAGDPFRMRELLEAMIPIFQARSLHQGMIAALILFRESVALRQADTALVRDLTGYLQRAQRDRTLRFRPTS